MDGDTALFTEPNGTDDRTGATSDAPDAPVPSNGSVEASGASVNESVAYDLVTYPVAFTESGLPVREEPAGPRSTGGLRDPRG